jgi:hypothetical protein
MLNAVAAWYVKEPTTTIDKIASQYARLFLNGIDIPRSVSDRGILQLGLKPGSKPASDRQQGRCHVSDTFTEGEISTKQMTRLGRGGWTCRLHQRPRHSPKPVKQMLLKARVGASLEKSAWAISRRQWCCASPPSKWTEDTSRRLLSQRRHRWCRSPGRRAGTSALDFAHAPTIAEQDPLTKFVIVEMATTFERTDVGR